MPISALPTLKMISSVIVLFLRLLRQSTSHHQPLPLPYVPRSPQSLKTSPFPQPPPTAHPHDLRPPHSPTTPRPSTRSSPLSGPPVGSFTASFFLVSPSSSFPFSFRSSLFFAAPWSSLLHDLLCPPSCYRYLSSFLLSPLGTPLKLSNSNARNWWSSLASGCL